MKVNDKQNQNLNRLGETVIKLLIICCLFFVKQGFSEDDIGIETVISKKSYSLGDTVVVAIKADIPSRYHLYGNPLGSGIGKALQISTGGFDAVRWIDVKKTDASKFYPPIGEWVWAYEKETVFFLTGVVDKGIRGKDSGSIVFDGLICHLSCIPVSKQLSVTIDISENSDDMTEHFGSNKSIAENYSQVSGAFNLDTKKSNMALSAAGLINLADSGQKILFKSSVNLTNNNTVLPEWNYTAHENSVKINILVAILLGFIAGIILNFMPCVLPVLGVKIVSFSKSREGSRRETVLRSLSFALGIVSVFIAFAALASFANFSWGQQFQDPRVLLGIIVLIVIFALGTFDIFMINVPGSVANLERKSNSGVAGDFFKGVFTTIMATPCSGPFLGATLAWAITQNSVIIFAVFISIGLGMAFPYVLLSLSSKLSGLIPKPGAWMNDFKMFTGFVLLGMAVYMMTSLPQDMVVPAVCVSVFTAFAIVVYTRYAPFGSGVRRKLFSGIAALVIVVSGVYISFGVIHKNTNVDYNTEISDSEWNDFSFEKLGMANENKQNVIVDFTAKWCMNCKINKAAVLNTDEIRALIKEKNILPMKVDLTLPDSLEQAFLYHLGSRSVPFLAIFPGNDPYNPIIMRDLLNKGELVKVLGKL